MNRAAICIVFLMLCAASASASTEQSLREACTEVIQDRLASPASFTVIEWFPMTSHLASKEEALGPAPTREEFGTGYDSAVELYGTLEKLFSMGTNYMLQIVVEYDASNAYGVPIRNRSVCAYHITGPDDGDENISVGQVKLDGETMAEHAINNLKALLRVYK